jgi:RimJ/RimL family protein N-acetyltransferase
MPFEIPWTDTVTEQSVVDYHELALRELTPDDWQLNLLAFHRGHVIGMQGIGAERFAERHIVVTGSWLGRWWQGRGLGTEMRAAVLQFAFAGLGADLARSGAIAGNPQSLGVSRKLGYEVVGSHTVSPRGAALEHTDVELRRESFRSPVAVEIVALEPLLPMFGAR